jgi:hypothetical protein
MTRFLFVLLVSLSLSLHALADGPGLSLRISDESVPAGSTVQIKVDVTEPKPISTGRGKIKTRGITTLKGVVLMNEGQDSYGVAMEDGEELSFNIVSPSSVFGTAPDYPILGIVATAVNASNGTSFPLTLDPAGLGFHDPSGAVYPYEVKNGTLTISSGAIAISDVEPGSAVIPAGGTVRISGTNFTPNTRIDLGEASVASQHFINSSRIDVVLGSTARMHGMRIRARNEGKNGEQRSECEYFSYERTAAIGASSDPVFSKTVALYAPATYTDAVVAFPRSRPLRRRSVRPASEGASTSRPSAGFALQNLEQSTALVSVELLDDAGFAYAVNTMSIGPDQHLVREVGEVFGIVRPPSAIRIRSNVSIHVLGLTTDPTTGGAAALPPH